VNPVMRNVVTDPTLSDVFSKVVVAVIDTGVDAGHPDLNVTFSISKITGDSSTADEVGHGTHVAGIIGARDNDLGVRGVCPNVQIWNVRVLGVNGGTDADVIAGVEFCTSNASTISVVNMSLGGQGDDPLLTQAVNNCINAGITVVIAAGNDSNNV